MKGEIAVKGIQALGWDMRKLDALLESGAGEITPEIEQALENLKANKEIAFPAAGLYLKQLEAVRDFRKAFAKQSIEEIENKIETIKKTMLSAMEIGEKIDGTESTVACNKNRASVELGILFDAKNSFLLDNCLVIPDTTYKPSKTAMKEYIEKNGINSLSDYGVTMSEGGKTLKVS